MYGKYGKLSERLLVKLKLIGVWAPTDLRGGDFLSRNYVMPEGVEIEHRRSSFSHLMKLLSLEK